MPQEKIIAKPQTIVVIEDDLAMREIVVHKLTNSGYKTFEAEDGPTGIQAIIDQRPHVVLLDLMIPIIDGFGVLESIRKNPDKDIASTPIIILSNLWSNKDLIRTKTYKIDAYLVKTYFTTQEILQKVQEVIANHSKDKK